MTCGPAKEGERNIKAKYFHKMTLKSGFTSQVAAQKSDRK